MKSAYHVSTVSCDTLRHDIALSSWLSFSLELLNQIDHVSPYFSLYQPTPKALSLTTQASMQAVLCIYQETIRSHFQRIFLCYKTVYNGLLLLSANFRYVILCVWRTSPQASHVNQYNDVDLLGTHWYLYAYCCRHHVIRNNRCY